MANISSIEYLRLNKFQKFIYNLKNFILSIPSKFKSLIFKIGRGFKNAGIKIGKDFADVFLTFKNGDWKTRASFLVMGLGQILRGQILRGIFFLLFEIVFIIYLVLVGFKYLGQLDNLGEVATIVTHEEVEIIPGIIQLVPKTIYVDNSFQILLYGVLTIFFAIAFIYTWRLNVRQNKIAQEIIQSGKKLKSGKEDLNSMLDDQFHKTLLALPLTGIVVFTVFPLVFMILIAFTNYDINHMPPDNLFTWVGFDNFKELVTWSNGSSNFAATFGELLTWTLIWAFFATFSNYFLGMLVAMMINKKGIKLKKLWRTILVMTIAVPQFISLLYVSKMFATDGVINGTLKDLGLITEAIPFFTKPEYARVSVILINIWVGIPYLMLITTGVLMNIPKDLYESAKIDGANSLQTYTKITLPYMLFVTGPYLLTSFIGNMNNFNVIYLLTGGAPTDIRLTNGAGYTDLLVTWLYKLVMDNKDFKLASVIGIMVFVVSAVISLIVYNVMPSMKNEEDFQ